MDEESLSGHPGTAHGRSVGIPLVLALLGTAGVLACCGGDPNLGPADSGASDDGSTEGAAVSSDASLLDATVSSDGSMQDATSSLDASPPDATSGTDGSQDDATPSSDAGDAGGYAGPTIRIEGIMVSYPCTHCEGIPALTVCVYDEPSLPCAITGTFGNFDIGVPANRNTALTFVADGYDSALMAVTTSSSDQSGWEIGLSPANEMTALAGALGLPFPATTTCFVTTGVEAYPPGDPNALATLVGATIAIDPASDAGTLYQTSTLTPDPGATSTTSSGAAFFGNVGPGEISVVYTAASGSLTCVPAVGGWRGAVANEIRVPVAAGFDSYANVYCVLTGADTGADASEGASDAGDAASD
jgi:hypothetical protein